MSQAKMKQISGKERNKDGFGCMNKFFCEIMVQK